MVLRQRFQLVVIGCVLKAAALLQRCIRFPRHREPEGRMSSGVVNEGGMCWKRPQKFVSLYHFPLTLHPQE